MFQLAVSVPSKSNISLMLGIFGASLKLKIGF
jgi:hypothetical protein